MKLIFMIAAFYIVSPINEGLKYLVSPATYYVDFTGGNDNNNGLTTGAAFKTISKVLSVVAANDSIKLKRGESWNERFTPSVGNLWVGAYSTGNKPIITGFQSLSVSDQGSNVWGATATNSVKQLNTVLINGSIRAKARTPNSSYNTYTPASSTQTSLLTSLTGTPSYVGYEIAVRTAPWVTDVTKITAQSTGTITINPLTYTPNLGGTGWFFQNNNADLDAANEYTYDSTSKALKVYATSSPTVQISSVDTLVWLRSKDYITFDGISFTGANKAAFQLDTASHITIQNCSINNCGTLGISGKKSSYVSILNDSIQNCLSGAIYLRQVDPYTPTVNTCDNATITGNYIKNTAIYAGMGMNDNCRYMTVYLVGNSGTISNNTIDSSGYLPIIFNGTNTLVKNNYVSNFCFVKDDGAGIYTVIGAYFTAGYNDGSIVRGNIVTNGLGAAAGSNGLSASAGLYADDGARSVTWDSNTVYNCNKKAISLHATNSLTFRNNTVVDGIGDCIYLQDVSASNGSSIKRNISYSTNSSYRVLVSNTANTVQSIDSNFYYKPVQESTLLHWSPTTYNLTDWKASGLGYDAHTSGTPSGTSSSTPNFYYNPTSRDSTIHINGLNIDPYGNEYNYLLTMQPFRSYVLFKEDHEVPIKVRIGNTNMIFK